jgi:hypothetical protein
MIDFARNGKFSPKIGFDETEWGYFWLDQKKCHSVSSHSTGIFQICNFKQILTQFSLSKKKSLVVVVVFRSGHCITYRHTAEIF